MNGQKRADLKKKHRIRVIRGGQGVARNQVAQNIFKSPSGGGGAVLGREMFRRSNDALGEEAVNRGIP